MGTKCKRLIIYTDGSCRPNPGPAAIGVVIKNEQGEVKARISQDIGQATNNKAEYRAVIAGLEKAAQLGAEQVQIYLDSELVLKQLTGEYRVKKRELLPLYQKTKELLSKFTLYALEHISGENNTEAHSLAIHALPRDDV